jgi:hypothetical protein
MRLPIPFGENVMLMLQFAPAPTKLPQVFVWVKSPLAAPVTVMLLMFKAPLPVLLSTTDLTPLLVPIR